MFEHVGLERLREYFARLFELLSSEGRLMNHAIGRPPGTKSRAKRRGRFARNSFTDRYVFPDGELHEVGEVVSAIQREGFEVRHLETLREHYALTLRAWVRNLEDNWEEAVSLVGLRFTRCSRRSRAAAGTASLFALRTNPQVAAP
jgi:cyclopropane-fatty-acyl-phospholipid synthase